MQIADLLRQKASALVGSTPARSLRESTMNPEDIDNLQAGTELDALIAENVMGEKPPFSYPVPHNHAWQCSGPRPYSTDIAAAWHVWEKIGQPTISRSNPRGQIMVWVTEDYMGPDQVAEADTAPLAICRAALKAKAIASQQATEPAK